MKKSIVIIISLALLFTFLPAKLIAGAEVKYGDVNTDGQITADDLTMLRQYLAGYDYAEKTAKFSVGTEADTTGNGTVDGRDVLRLAKYLAGKDVKLGPASNPVRTNEQGEIILPIVPISSGTAGAGTSDGTLNVPDIKAYPGGTASITVSLKANRGLSFLSVRPFYSDALTLVNIRCENATYTMTADDNIIFDAVSDVTNDLDMVTFTFKVSENAVPGSVCVFNLNINEAYKYSEADSAFTAPPAKVMIESAFESAGVTAGEDLSLKLKLKSDTAPTVRFTQGEDVTEITGEADGEKTWTVSYPGICPQHMADEIKMELLDGETVKEVKRFSIRQYCGLLAASDAKTLGITQEKYDALMTFLADMLSYGAAAQTYKNYNISDPADSPEWVGEKKSAAPVKPVTDFAQTVARQNNTDFISSATLRLDDRIRMCFKFAADEADSIVISGGMSDKTVPVKDLEKTGSYYEVYSDAVKACELEKVFTVTLKKGDTVLNQITYSVNSYVSAKFDSAYEPLSDLVKAICNYGSSAAKYINVK